MSHGESRATTELIVLFPVRVNAACAFKLIEENEVCVSCTTSTFG